MVWDQSYCPGKVNIRSKRVRGKRGYLYISCVAGMSFGLCLRNFLLRYIGTSCFHKITYQPQHTSLNYGKDGVL